VKSRATAGVVCLAATIALATDGLPGEAFIRPLAFKLGSSSLDDIRDRLGPAKLMTTGLPAYDGGMPTNAVCYVAPARGVRFGFKASGPRRTELESSDFWMGLDDRAPGSCHVLSGSVEGGLTFNIGGLRFGMTRDDFQGVVGKTTTDDRGRLTAQFTQREPPPSGGKDRTGPVDRRKIVILVEGTFDSKGLNWLGVWRVQTQSAGGPTKE
jgi:hypothetical protein